jgi:hypothetical protein
MPIILGIDPGLKGAIAKLDTGLGSLMVFDMPTFVVTKSKTKRYIDLNKFKDVCLRGGAPDIAWIEEVHSSPQMGVVSAFSFGASYAGCLGVLAGLGITTEKVLPSRWKAALKAPADKDASRARATALMPSCGSLWAKSTQDGRAEAAMLCLYGAFTHNIQVKGPIYAASV